MAGQALAALLEARARSQMGGAPGPMGPLGPMGAPRVMMNPMMVGGFNPMMMHPAMAMGGGREGCIGRLLRSQMSWFLPA